MRPVVALVLDEAYGARPEIRERIDRYEADHPGHEFREIPFSPDTAPIASMEDRGGTVKRNWLEVRNTLRDLAAQVPHLDGVWVIARTLPKIWRDPALFYLVTPSPWKASIYPLVALSGDWYADFDVETGGFIEIPGATTGRGRGDGYPADVWGAALVPASGWGDEIAQLAGFFDRNHGLVEHPPASRTLLHADTFGFTSKLAPRIDATGYFSSADAIFLGPDSHPELSGFSRFYLVMVHEQGPDFEPAGSGGCLTAEGPDELAELEEWEQRTYFPDQAEFRRIGDERCYYFSLLIRGHSLPPEEVRATLEAQLPPLACASGTCFVYVKDTYFASDSGIPIDGRWDAFPQQQAAFQNLYTQALEQEVILYTHVSTHGSPDEHFFGISSSWVREHSFSSLIYELQACSTADLAESSTYLAGTYLFFGGAQVVTGYAQPALIQCSEGDCLDYYRYLAVRPGVPLAEILFDHDYSMHLYFGDPLLVLP